MNILAKLLGKSPTASSVHVRTALGNERQRKQEEFNQVIADQSDEDSADERENEEGEDVDKKFTKANVVKVDEGLGLVIGFAIVSKLDGNDYFDLQGDHIPEQSMLEAATDFMLHSRVSKDMHTGDQDGSVVFAFPLTTDIAKSLDIETKRTGLLIAMKPSPEVLTKFKDGTYTGFSIGGQYVTNEEVE